MVELFENGATPYGQATNEAVMAEVTTNTCRYLKETPGGDGEFAPCATMMHLTRVCNVWYRDT